MESFEITREMLLGINIYRDTTKNEWTHSSVVVNPEDGMIHLGIDEEAEAPGKLIADLCAYSSNPENGRIKWGIT